MKTLLSLISLINLILVIAFIIGIPYFMFTVVKLLKKIENRLENIDSTLEINKNSNLTLGEDKLADAR